MASPSGTNGRLPAGRPRTVVRQRVVLSNGHTLIVAIERPNDAAPWDETDEQALRMIFDAVAHVRVNRVEETPTTTPPYK